MKIIVLGGTGLLGQAVVREVARRGHTALVVARRGGDIALDIGNGSALHALLAQQAGDAVVNCAACVDMQMCEDDPALAWVVNGRPAGILAEWAQKHDRPFIQISTDQFFVDGANRPHREDAVVTLVNEYARTKFAGEALAQTASQALVLRTSIVGIRGWDKPTFAEWALDVIRKDRPATLFADAYTSSIDVETFSRAAFDLLEKGARGLYNLAADEVYSKEDFVREMARQLGYPLSRVVSGTVLSMPTRRAGCLGLDVSRARTVLNYPLPDLAQVIHSVLAEAKRAIS